jgi:thiamine biosynthesis protein ThiS
MSNSDTINVILNGKKTELGTGQCILDLLSEKGLDPRIVMVEVNEEAVRRDRFAEIRIDEGDRIEIVRMIAGG